MTGQQVHLKVLISCLAVAIIIALERIPVACTGRLARVNITACFTGYIIKAFHHRIHRHTVVIPYTR